MSGPGDEGEAAYRGRSSLQHFRSRSGRPHDHDPRRRPLCHTDALPHRTFPPMGWLQQIREHSTMRGDQLAGRIEPGETGVGRSSTVPSRRSSTSRHSGPPRWFLGGGLETMTLRPSTLRIAVSPSNPEPQAARRKWGFPLASRGVEAARSTRLGNGACVVVSHTSSRRCSLASHSLVMLAPSPDQGSRAGVSANAGDRPCAASAPDSSCL